MAIYEATVKWQRAPDDHFIDQKYSRAHEWLFDGGARVRGSASPHSVRPPYADPSAVDPEEALLAALASCHMLFFLWFAAKRGFNVSSYEDSAVGLMEKDARGRQSVTKVTLRPHVVFDGDNRPTEAELACIHHDSHDHCYVANSVRSEIIVEGRADGLRV